MAPRKQTCNQVERDETRMSGVNFQSLGFVKMSIGDERWTDGFWAHWRDTSDHIERRASGQERVNDHGKGKSSGQKQQVRS